MFDKKRKKTTLSSMVVHPCHLSTQEVKTGRLPPSGPHSEPCVRNQSWVEERWRKKKEIGLLRTKSAQRAVGGYERDRQDRELLVAVRGTERTGRNGKNTRVLKSSRGWDSLHLLTWRHKIKFLAYKTTTTKPPCFRIPVSISSAQHKSQQRGLREDKLQERGQS